VNPFNMPDHGQPATSRFAFPMGTTEMELWSEFGYGLTTFDCDFDLNDDIVTVHSENSLSRYTEIGADFNGDGVLQQLDLDDTALNGNEIVVFAVHNVNLDTDPETDIGADVMFLDNLARVTDVGNDQVQFTIYRTSGTTQENIQPQRISAISLEPGQMQLIEHTSLGTKLSRNQNNLGQTDGAWFIYLEALDDGHNRCVVTVGRALGCTHTAMDIDGSMDTKRGDPWYMKRFYVDGHEYNVVAIMTVREDDRVAGGWNNSKEEKYEFKYITIRTEIPKVPVTIEQHSVRKQEYIPCSDGLDHYISVMPPFNDYHTCKEDIQDGWATTDAELKNLSDNKYKGDVIKNKPPVLIHIEAEEREPQFKGELKEKYNKRPLIDIPGIGNPPVAGTYPGYIDGRAISCTVTTATTVPWTENDEDNDVVGDVDNRKAGTISYRWEIVDVTGPGVDRIYNQQGQDVSTMRGKFVLYDWDDNGVDEWIMCVDYLNLRETLWADGVAALNEDYMCFFAVDYDETGDYYWLPNNFNDWQDNYAAGPGQIYTDRWVEWETWMTEQFHTIPDVYTEISIDEGPDETKDQLYMLTSAWVSDQSQLRAIYYEDSYLRQTDDPHLYEFYVPAEFFTIVNGGVANIEIFLTHTHDRQQILLELLDGTLNPLASDNPAYAHDCVISWPVNEPGKYWVRISADAIWSPDLEPEYYNVTIEVRTQGARVKFWYDPDDTQDLYVNSVGTPSDCIAGMGDYNKNGAVDFTDFVAFAQAYNNPGGYTECFDFDEDGDIDFTDFVAFAQRYPLDSCRTSNCPSCSGTFAGDPGEPPWAYWEPTDPVCP